MAGQFAEKLFNGAVALEARAKQVAAKAQALQGQPSVRQIEDQSVAEALFVPGGNPMNGLVGLQKVAQGLYKAYPQMLQAAESTIGQLSHADGFINVGEDAKFAYPWTAQMLSGWASEANGNRLMSAVLPGNMRLEFFISDDVGNSEAVLDQIGDVNAKAALPVLSAPQAGTVANQVAAIAALVKQSKQEISKAVAAGQKLAQVARNFSMLNNVSQDESVKAKADAARQAVLAIKKALDEPFKSFNVYAIRTGNAALNWVEKSAAVYGAAAPAAAKPAAGEVPAKA
jgi:hypothetical protein